NPDWSAADWSGKIPEVLHGTQQDFRVESVFWYDEPIPFTHETWRGRIRASRGVGAALSPEEVARFDTDHARMLRDLVPEEFTVLHRIDAHVLVPLQENR
ncbi:MAG: class I SAM-dependent methyltransferase, partial [Gemmatimonadetes bacterium]|nr:class I SAM-dependent methyltransferase [Gemmatimonadota bacterium]